MSDKNTELQKSIASMVLRWFGEPVLSIEDELVSYIEQERAKAVEEAVTKIMMTPTEGMFSNTNELYIKRAPIEQTFVELIGYEKHKAIKEAATKKGEDNE